MTSTTQVRLREIQAEVEAARRAGDISSMQRALLRKQRLLESVYGKLA